MKQWWLAWFSIKAGWTATHPLSPVKCRPSFALSRLPFSDCGKCGWGRLTSFLGSHSPPWGSIHLLSDAQVHESPRCPVVLCRGTFVWFGCPISCKSKGEEKRNGSHLHNTEVAVYFFLFCHAEGFHFHMAKLLIFSFMNFGYCFTFMKLTLTPKS